MVNKKGDTTIKKEDIYICFLILIYSDYISLLIISILSQILFKKPLYFVA